MERWNYNDHYLYAYLEFLLPYVPIPCENECGVQPKNFDDKSVKAGNDPTNTSKDKVVTEVITSSDATSTDETNSLSEQNVDEGN